MKKYINKIIKLTIVLAIIIGFRACEVHALPYYDLKFEETSKNIIKGEYEKLGKDINFKKDSKMNIKIKKLYEPKISIELNKDEEDAISQVLGNKWKESVLINKEESIDTKDKKNTYIQVRTVYKEIKGYLIQDYYSWNKKKELTILIPIDVECILKIN